MAHRTRINTATDVVALIVQKRGELEPLEEKKAIKQEDKATDL
jgi:hypothetical protein